ncbi:hypothetical protein Taro_041697, partial [Colocasia esculenta]|nr:hypothetical protein [Colocasia esculenta]
ADVKLSNGQVCRAAVPSGASTGVYEALELRDGGSDYLGKGVLKAVENVNSIIAPALIGKFIISSDAMLKMIINLQFSNAENKEGLELLKTAIAKAGYTGKVVIGMDVAASEFYSDKDKTYDLNFKAENNDGSQKISGDSLKNVYKSFVADYPIVSIEDPFDQDDWTHYAKMTEEIGAQVQIVGDDLLVTNPTRVAKAIKEKSCNALLLKVNQIGTVTESIEAVKMSKHAGWGVMASHRSGETEDTFIADLSVGLATGQIKTGAPCRSERLAKYNQLLRIEEELGAAAVYAGEKFRTPVAPY